MVSRIKKFTAYYAILNFCVGIFLLITTIVAIGGYFFLKKRYIETVIKQTDTTIIACIDNITQYIQLKQHETARIAATPEIIHFAQDPHAAPLPTAFQKKIASFTQASMLFDKNNQPIFLSDEGIKQYASNSLLQESMQRAKILLNPDLSDFVIDPITQIPHLFITAPIIIDQHFLGTFVTEIDTATIIGAIAQTTSNKDAHLIITQSRDNEIVSLFHDTQAGHNFFAHIELTPANYYDAFAQATTGHRGHRITQNKAGKEQLLVWHYMPLTQWGFIFEQSYSAINSKFLMLKLFLGFIALACSMLIFYFLYKSLLHARKTMPLTEMLTITILTTLYLIFIISTASIVPFLAHSYFEYKILRSKDSLQFKGMLQKAAQMVDYRVSILETVANAFAFDSANFLADPQKIESRIHDDMQENPDLFAMILAHKENGVWKIITEKQDDLTITRQELKELPAWLNKILTHQATWLFIPTTLSVASQAVYGIALYNPDDFEQRKPIGLICLVYSRDTLISQAEQKASSLPLMLVLGDGSIAYHDPALHLVGKSIQVHNGKEPNLYTEKMPHLGWYLASVSKGIVYSIAQIIILISKFLMLILSIAVVLHAFLGYVGSRHEKEKKNRSLIRGLTGATLFLALFYLLKVFGV